MLSVFQHMIIPIAIMCTIYIFMISRLIDHNCSRPAHIMLFSRLAELDQGSLTSQTRLNLIGTAEKGVPWSLRPRLVFLPH